MEQDKMTMVKENGSGQVDALGGFEQLPEAVLQRNYGDFGRCEGQWNPFTRDMTERFLKAAQNFTRTVGEPDPFEDVETVMKQMVEEGRVVHLPLGYMRAHNSYPKCPRCGQAIMEDVPAVSRYDNKRGSDKSCG